MPNLNERDVVGWLATWRGSPQSDWPPSVRPIEQQDDVPSFLEALGDALEVAGEVQAGSTCAVLMAGQPARDFRTALAQMGAGRTLKILHWLSELDLPESRALLDALLRDRSSDGVALCALVDALRRRATLHRLFAPDRLAALEEVCAETLKEDA